MRDVYMILVGTREGRAAWKT